MTTAHPAQSTSSASRHEEGVAAAFSLAKWLSLAATPTFAIMALLTGLGGSSMDRLCSSGHGAPLGGMVTMYLLMSAFHSPPWLTLILRRRSGVRTAERMVLYAAFRRARLTNLRTLLSRDGSVNAE
jgi:hypothetical protein